MTKQIETPETSKVLRIHVGGISKELANNVNELEERFGKIGKIVKPFEIHEKPVLDYYFGFITMKLNVMEFRNLKKSWNDVKFKGSRLTIAIAKDDYLKIWDHDFRRQDTKILDRKRRQKVADERNSRLLQKNVNPFKLLLVSKGRIRKTPRKTDLKNLTIRVNINGKLKIIKCKKTKLWGMAKNKTILDLTNRFIAGEWRDGNDHVIDRLSNKIVIFNHNNRITVHDEIERSDEKEIEEEFNEEKAKNNKILEEMLNKYNFDKPVDLDDANVDNDKDFDYELENRVADMDVNNDDKELNITYNIPSKDCVKPSKESILEEYNLNNKNFISKKIESEEKDHSDDDDFYKNLRPENQEKGNDEIIHELAENPNDSKDPDEEFIPSFGESNKSNIENEGDNDDEFIPTFGASKNITLNEQDQTNTTEKLRELLSYSDTMKTDKKDEEFTETRNVQEDMILPNLRKNKNVGLFFSHFDSPFLVAQSQINKLREINVNEELGYDEWFFRNRGELNREFRRLRRDLIRRNKKKLKTSSFI